MNHHTHTHLPVAHGQGPDVVKRGPVLQVRVLAVRDLPACVCGSVWCVCVRWLSAQRGGCMGVCVGCGCWVWLVRVFDCTHSRSGSCVHGARLVERVVVEQQTGAKQRAYRSVDQKASCSLGTVSRVFCPVPPDVDRARGLPKPVKASQYKL